MHRVFLHQALLAGLIIGELGGSTVRRLPPGYSYPLDFHTSVPRPNRALSLEDVVCSVYEGRFVYPGTLNGLEPGPCVGPWLEERLPS